MPEREPSLPNNQPDETQEQVKAYLLAHPELRLRMKIEQQLDQTLSDTNAVASMDQVSESVSNRIDALDSFAGVITDTLQSVGIREPNQRRVNEFTLRLMRFSEIWAENYPHNMKAIEQAQRELSQENPHVE